MDYHIEEVGFKFWSKFCSDEIAIGDMGRVVTGSGSNRKVGVGIDEKVGIAVSMSNNFLKENRS